MVNECSWLFFGGRGWIGHKMVQEIRRIAPEQKIVLFPGRVQSYRDSEVIRNFIRTEKISRVVDCIGKTYGPGKNNIDYLKGNLKTNLDHNLLAHFVIMNACKEAQVHLTILGTGCIYENDGTDRKFSDDDMPNYFASEYSVVKGILDQMIHLHENILHLKIRMPVDSEVHPRNLITKLVGYKAVTHQPNSMSVLPDLIPIMIQFAVSSVTGNYNMVNDGTMTHAKIMDRYKDMVDATHTYELLSPEQEAAILTQGRCNNEMSTSKTNQKCRELCIPEPGRLSNQIDLCLQQYMHMPKFCTILVTGGNGFIASHLLEFLHGHYPQANLVNVDRQLSVLHDRSNWNNFHEYPLDIADELAMADVFRKHKVDVVFHLAAETHVDASFENSLDFTHSNVLGTHTLLEQCRKSSHRIRFIHMSTDEVYGGSDELKNETSPTNPTNPYAATKVAAEALCQAYLKSFQLPIVIVRCNNVYGEYQLPEKVIPRFICRRLAGNLPLEIQGDGSAKRSFVYVGDVIQALHLVSIYGKVSEIYNIDSKDEISVRDLAGRISELVPSARNELVPIPDRKFQDVRYHIDASKIRRLGWQQTVSFEQGLQQCIDWYQLNIRRFPKALIGIIE